MYILFFSPSLILTHLSCVVLPSGTTASALISRKPPIPPSVHLSLREIFTKPATTLTGNISYLTVSQLLAVQSISSYKENEKAIQLWHDVNPACHPFSKRICGHILKWITNTKFAKFVHMLPNHCKLYWWLKLRNKLEVWQNKLCMGRRPIRSPVPEYVPNTTCFQVCICMCRRH